MVGSVRGGAGCDGPLCGSVSLPKGLGISLGGPPAGVEACPPRARAGWEEPEAGGPGWGP